MKAFSRQMSVKREAFNAALAAKAVDRRVILRVI